MDYEEFKERLMEDVVEALKEKGIDAVAKENRTEKMDSSYDAIVFTPEGSNVGATLNIEALYQRYEEVGDYQGAVDHSAELMEKALSDAPQFDESKFFDYEQSKANIVMQVVSADNNYVLLDNMPHREMEDMAIIYRYMVGEDQGLGVASIAVTNPIMERWGVTEEQLHADALENSPKLMPLKIAGITETLTEMMGPEGAEIMGIMSGEPEPMYVASNESKINGAGVIAYEGFMEEAAERAGGSFYILPSSKHEVLIVPDNGLVDYRNLKEMVEMVNANEVDPQDKLTDSVYHYDAEEKIFEKAESFEERQTEKAEEKSSILEDLKNKKEEVAKQPHKDVQERVAKTKGGEAL